MNARRAGARFDARSSPGWSRAFACLLVLLAGPLARLGAETAEVTTFRQLERMPMEEAQQGRPVRFSGVVICYDRDWGQFYVHDGATTRYFSPALFTNRFELGDAVSMTGQTAWIEGSGGLTNLQVAVVGKRDLPQPVRLDPPQLASAFGQWVETRGRVRSADNSRGRLGMIIHRGGRDCQVYVLGASASYEFRPLLDREVRLRGINGSKVVQGRLEAAIVFVPGLNDLEVLGDSPTDLNGLPVVSIDALLSRPLGDWTNRMVRVNGLISAYRPGESLVVRDPTGTIRAEVAQVSRALEDQRVDVWGYLTMSASGAVLRYAFFEPTSVAGEVAAPSEAPPAASAPLEPGHALDRVAQIMSLPREKLQQHLPVRLRGTLTYADPEFHNGFFQDETDAIYVDLRQSDARSGQYVELFGETDPGGFAPQVNGASVRVLGMTNLPPAIPVSLDELAEGQYDSHWIEIRGVVRRAEVEWGRLYLTLTSSKGRFRTVIPGFADQPVPNQLIDCLVSVPGACTSEVNARGQLTGITLHTPRLDQIRVLDPIPADPFGVSVRPVASVSTFDPQRRGAHRVKVSGVVTFLQPQTGFFLQDDSGGMRVGTQQTNTLATGDRVEVLGFPTLGEFSPYLEDASFRRTGSGPLPPPRKTTAEEILRAGQWDGSRVELEGWLLQEIQRSAQPRLVLQEGSIIFTAHLVVPDPNWWVQAPAPGSRLRLVGICRVQGEARPEPEGFRLLLASAADVRLLSAPSWWTSEHALALAGGLGLAILAALAWVALLRRRVRLQTEIIRQKLEERKQIEGELLEISTQERRRIGHELHDGLGQQLAGIALKAKVLEQNLAAVGSAEVARTKQVVALLNDAVRQTRGLAQGLDPVHVEAGGIVPALGNLATHTSELYHVDCTFVCSQERLEASPKTSLALYRITQEAVRNAVLHGRARHVEVRLALVEDRLCLEVRDNGQGFASPAENSSGMGLHIMRYRAGSVGGELRVDSTPRMGAIVTCTVPLKPSSPADKGMEMLDSPALGDLNRTDSGTKLA